jgi:hypothetical protein
MTQLFHRPEIVRVLKLQKELEKVKRVFYDEFFYQYANNILSLAEYKKNCVWIRQYLQTEIATVERLYLFGKHDKAEHEIAGMAHRFGFNI